MQFKRIVGAITSVVLVVFLILCYVVFVKDDKEVEEIPKAETIQNEDHVQTEPMDVNAPLEVNEEIKGDITVWVPWGEDTEQAKFKQFQRYYPNIKVKAVRVENMRGMLNDAILLGKDVPDVVYLNSLDFGEFNAMEGLEDLNQHPYLVERYRPYLSEAALGQFTSLDGKKQLAFPDDFSPFVTWYRADVMEQHGFPSDPAELGEYIQEPANWLKIAQTLKNNDQFITMSAHDVINLAVENVGFFDHELNYIRNNEELAKMLDIAREVRRQGLESHVSIWDLNGRKALDRGELAMTYTGIWFGDCCLRWDIKDSFGKWRITNPPMGAAQSSGGSGWAIPTNSYNKEAAWAYIEFFNAKPEGVFSNIENGIWDLVRVKSYKPTWNHPAYLAFSFDLLGGQKPYEFVADMIDETVPYPTRTPLDSKAGEIWGMRIEEALYSNKDSSRVLQDIQAEIEAAVKEDKELYSLYLAN